MTYSERPVSPGGGTDGDMLYCANHPNVPTYLRCGKCEKPICARCRVHTPIGYRCYDCARLTVLPTYAISPTYYGRAALGGFAFATLLGLIWAVLPGFDFWAALILGIGTAEAVAAAANQKRGPGLQIVGLLAVVWGAILSRLALAYMLQVPSLATFIVQIPGNNTSALLGRALRSGLHAGDPLGLFLVLVQRTDAVGFLFVALALGLTYLRLR